MLQISIFNSIWLFMHEEITNIKSSTPHDRSFYLTSCSYVYQNLPFILCMTFLNRLSGSAGFVQSSANHISFIYETGPCCFICVVTYLYVI